MSDILHKEGKEIKEIKENHRKTKEVINYRSAYEALTKGFIEGSDILNYLLVSDVSDRTMIAYKAVCCFGDQIIKNNYDEGLKDKHFITVTKSEEYICIYSLTVTNEKYRTDEEKKEISKIKNKIWPKLISINDFSRKINIICDTKTDILLKNHEFWIVVAARSTKLIYKNSNIVKYPRIIIGSDLLEPLYGLDYKSYENILLSRCELLSESAPKYWSFVAKELYKEHVCEHVNVDKYDKIEASLLRRYAKLFPDIFPEEVINMTDLEYNIRELPEMTQAYVLGFPIHLYVPSKNMIEKAVKFLNEAGIEKYCDIIVEKNKKLLNNTDDMILPWNRNEIIKGNENNSMLDPVYDHNTFDVIKYYIDTHVYYFTRNEFSTLITKKANIWTNEKIPLSVLNEAAKRCETSATFNLPTSSPINVMLEKLEKGELYSDNVNNNVRLNRLNTVSNNDRLNINDLPISPIIMGEVSSNLGNISSIFGMPNGYMGEISFGYNNAMMEDNQDETLDRMGEMISQIRSHYSEWLRNQNHSDGSDTDGSETDSDDLMNQVD